jgi:DNA-binding NarL/FixJ family response regulator
VRKKKEGSGKKRTRVPAGGTPIRPLTGLKIHAPIPGKPDPPFYVLIATQPAIFRELLHAFLDSQPGLHVVGEAYEENQIGDLLSQKRPSVLVFDYEALGPNAEAAIFRLRREAPDTRILVLASRSTEETTQRVLRAGGSGVVGKHLDCATLVRAIRSVARGEAWATRQTIARTLYSLSSSDQSSTPEAALTKRQWEIVDGVGRGLRNKEIARRLQISEKTVKSHLNTIFRKLQVNNRFAVGLYALDFTKQKPQAEREI